MEVNVETIVELVQALRECADRLEATVTVQPPAPDGDAALDGGGA